MKGRSLASSLIALLLIQCGLVLPPAWAQSNWTEAVLTPTDLGPGFEVAGDDSTRDSLLDWRTVILRRTDPDVAGPVVLSTTVARMRIGFTPGFFGNFVRGATSSFDLLAQVAGPRVGEETQWFAGQLPSNVGPLDAVAVACQVNETLIFVLATNWPGEGSQDEVLAYTQVVAKRLGGPGVPREDPAVR